MDRRSFIMTGASTVAAIASLTGVTAMAGVGDDWKCHFFHGRINAINPEDLLLVRKAHHERFASKGYYIRYDDFTYKRDHPVFGNMVSQDYTATSLKDMRIGPQIETFNSFDLPRLPSRMKHISIDAISNVLEKSWAA
jgi:hypothetical protein